MSEQYLISSFDRPTTAAALVIVTGTSIHTLLQVKLDDTGQMRAKVVEWGISFDASAAATPGKVELLSTKTVACTGMDAHVAAGIVNLDPLAAAPTTDNPFNLGTGTTAFSDGTVTEGTITDTRPFDTQLLPPTAPFVKQWPLGREPEFDDTEFVRIRVTFGAGINAYCYMVIEV